MLVVGRPLSWGIVLGCVAALAVACSNRGATISGTVPEVIPAELLIQAERALVAEELGKADSLLVEAMALDEGIAGAQELREWLAVLYAWRGWDANDRDEAFDDLNRAIALDPELAEAYAYRGCLHIDGDRNEAAVADLQRAIELDPYDSLAYTCRGGALVNLGRNDEALRDLDKSLALNAYDGYALSNRGAALLNLGRNEEALRDLEPAVGFEPGFALAHANLGAAYLNLGRFADARVSLDHALTLDPELKSARRNLAYLNAAIVQSDPVHE